MAADGVRAGHPDIGGPLDIGPPWAKITPARWGFWITFGISPLAMTESTWGGEFRWWRPTRSTAERKAQRLIDDEMESRVDRGWFHRPVGPERTP